MTTNYLPLEDTKDDKLYFGEQAERIATFINEFPSDVPCSISINGAWGTGKSSMLNFVENYLNPSRCDVIRFNPWMIEDKEQLLLSLFEEIYYCINGEEYIKIKQSFLEYIKKLSTPIAQVVAYLGATSSGANPGMAATISTATGKVVENISSDFFSLPLSKRKKALEADLLTMFIESQRKIVIMIDEIDRLFPEEIITVFQIIKCSLNFPGLIFIVAMDPLAVNDGIKKAGIENPKEYMQKIFHRSYNLNSKYQLKTLNREFLLNRISGYKEKQFTNLKDAVDAFFNINRENFINFSSDGGNVERVYYELYGRLREEFENPRTFIKLTDVILERWPVYYDALFLKGQAEDKHVQAAFLIFIVYFKYPEYVDIQYFNDIDNPKVNLPPLVKSIHQVINKICPVIEELGLDGKKTSRSDDIEWRSIKAIYQFPDLKLEN